MDEEISFHENGADVPAWFFVTVGIGLAIIAPLVLILILGGVK